MKYLLNDPDIFKAILSTRQIALFLDYDGTLAPIVEKPELAVLSFKTRKILEELAQREDFNVFVISGRSMADIKNLVRIDKIVYIGNHGFEIEGVNIDSESPPFLRFREILEYLKREITKESVIFKGVFVEDKGLGLSVHYRLLNLKNEPDFKHLLKEITDKFSSRNEIRVTSGKKVFEIRPPVDWDKGRALLWILKKRQFLGGKQKIVPIYIGDDTTDEDAFSAIKDIGITIYVGSQKSSHAQYYLNNTDEVIIFLEYLHGVKNNEKISKP